MSAVGDRNLRLPSLDDQRVSFQSRTHPLAILRRETLGESAVGTYRAQTGPTQRALATPVASTAYEG
jgi:hypothetical protein